MENELVLATNVTNTTDAIETPYEITYLDNGNFVVAYTSYIPATRSSDVYFAIYDTDGQLVSGPTNISNSSSNESVFVPVANIDPESITVLSDGSFAITWYESTSVDEDGAPIGDVYTAIYGADGQVIMPATNVSNTAQSNEVFFNSEALDGGAYAITWGSDGETYFAIYGSNGQELAPATNVTNTTDAFETPYEITYLDNGNFVVAYTSYSPATRSSDVNFAIYGADGQLVSGPSNVSNSSTGESAFVPTANIDPESITVLSDGSFAITWYESTSVDEDGAPIGDVYTAIYGADGQVIMPATNVSNTAQSNEVFFNSEALDGGAYAITWGSDGETYFAIYGSNGQELAPATNVTNTTDAFETPYEITYLDNGNFVVAYTSYSPATRSSDVNFAIYGADGQLVSGPTNVSNSSTGESAFVPTANIDPESITVLSDGSFAITWYESTSVDEDGSPIGDVYTAIYGADGQVIMPATNVSNTALSDERFFDSEALDGGAYAITWGSDGEVHLSVYGATVDDPIVVNGGGGSDTLIGGSGNDTLNGGNGGDDVFGGAGRDYIVGGNGSDFLDGGKGSDFIEGGNGTDTITGGSGDDSMAGGNGPDTFIFLPGDGSDIIADFSVGSDAIDLQGGQSISSFAEVDTDGSGGVDSTLIQFADGGSVILINVLGVTDIGTLL